MPGPLNISKVSRNKYKQVVMQIRTSCCVKKFNGHAPLNKKKIHDFYLYSNLPPPCRLNRGTELLLNCIKCNLMDSVLCGKNYITVVMFIK